MGLRVSNCFFLQCSFCFLIVLNYYFSPIFFANQFGFAIVFSNDSNQFLFCVQIPDIVSDFINTQYIPLIFLCTCYIKMVMQLAVKYFFLTPFTVFITKSAVKLCYVKNTHMFIFIYYSVFLVLCENHF